MASKAKKKAKASSLRQTRTLDLTGKLTVEQLEAALEPKSTWMIRVTRPVTAFVTLKASTADEAMSMAQAAATELPDNRWEPEHPRQWRFGAPEKM